MSGWGEHEDRILAAWSVTKDEVGHCVSCGYPGAEPHDCPAGEPQEVSFNVRLVPGKAASPMRVNLNDVEEQLGRLSAACTVIYLTDDTRKFEAQAERLDDMVLELQSRIDHLRNTWTKENEK